MTTILTIAATGFLVAFMLRPYWDSDWNTEPEETERGEPNSAKELRS